MPLYYGFGLAGIRRTVGAVEPKEEVKKKKEVRDWPRGGKENLVDNDVNSEANSVVVPEKTEKISPLQIAGKPIVARIDPQQDQEISSKNISGNEKFARLRVPIWRGSFEQIKAGMDWLSVLDRQSQTLRTGTYVITIRGKVQNQAGWDGRQVLEKPIYFKIRGKRQCIEKLVVDPDAGIIRMQIKIIDNPIAVLVLVSAALLSTGFAAYMITDTLVEVDKVLNDAIIWGVLGVVGFGAYVYLKRKKS